MLEKSLSVVAAITIPALGLLLQATRRNRLRRRIDEYLELAEKVTHDPQAVEELQRLAGEATRLLILKEERWLQRKLDPGAVVAVLFLTVPAAGLAAWAWTWSSGWRWPTVIVAAVWALLWGGVGLTQLWQERGDEAEAAAAS
jgi:hypothetical protein